jgi:hypothetical protein
VSLYLDASFIVPLFVDQPPLTFRATSFLENDPPELIVSDFGAAEFASAIARLVRMDLITAHQAGRLFTDFDAWTAQVALRAEITTADVDAAAASIRRLDLNLRTPDAMHVAVARRIGAALATFDDRMAENAVALGLEVLRI